MVLWLYCQRHICVVVGGGGFLFSSSAPCCCCWRQRLVVVSVLPLSVAASLLVTASVELCASSSLSQSAFRCRSWHLHKVGVVGISLKSAASICYRRRWILDIFLALRHRCQHLIAVSVSSLSTAASLLVAASVSFCASSPLSSPVSRWRRCCLLVVDGASLLFSLSSSSCRRRFCHLVVVGGVAAFSEKLILY